MGWRQYQYQYADTLNKLQRKYSYRQAEKVQSSSASLRCVNNVNTRNQKPELNITGCLQQVQMSLNVWYTVFIFFINVIYLYLPVETFELAENMIQCNSFIFVK